MADEGLCDCDVAAAMRHWKDTCPYGSAGVEPCELIKLAEDNPISVTSATILSIAKEDHGG